MISLGTSSRNDRSIQTAIGRFIAVYRMISTRDVSRMSRWAGEASTYRGTIAPTMGSIFVEMKKNRPSRQAPTGRIDSAYAAGNASTSTRIVEPIDVVSECTMKVLSPVWPPEPLQALDQFENVGLKKKCGVLVPAAVSVFRPVSTIQSTGKKKIRMISQVSTPSKSRAPMLVCRSATLISVRVNISAPPFPRR